MGIMSCIQICFSEVCNLEHDFQALARTTPVRL